MNIFITGGYGVLGSELAPLFKGRGHQLTVPTKEDFNIVKVNNIGPEFLYNSFQDIDIVVNLAAYTNVARAEKEYSLACMVNCSLDWLAYLPERCQVYHLSTDYVYDGNTPLSKETDLLEPFNAYGRSKALGDMKLLSYCKPNVHIIRTSFKPTIWPHHVAFDDMYTNADYVDVIAEKICSFILSSPPGGVYNIGTETKTIFDLVERRNKNVKPSSVSKFALLQKDVTMNLAKWTNYMASHTEQRY